ncbi:MAG: polysaccharide deacetylase family protein [Lentisphaerae bacterium]|nr:polysaccharide deacetylase family protein [Lentisphaerota bacterium]
MSELFFTVQVDCEATQHALRDPGLGERAIRGLGDILAKTGTRATFVVIPSDIRVHAAIYQELQTQGHEIGLHLHPADAGYQEFMGVHSYDEQVRMLTDAMKVFADCMGRKPEAFTPGYASANDHTFPALEAVGLRHGTVSIPTRDLPQCACVWGRSPLDLRYPHRFNRSLNGNVDFVDIPMTVDADSRMWGGAHPQDLRVELVDAKNHYYTMEKAIRRQVAAGDMVPVKYLKAITHNTFEYSDPANFRRETLGKMIEAARKLCEKHQCVFTPVTSAELAARYRQLVSRPKDQQTLVLDTRGRG